MQQKDRFTLHPGQILKMQREQSQLKQSALAKEISDRYGISISKYRLCRIEKGEYEMSGKELQAFADYFGHPAETYRTSRLIPDSTWFS